jgi:hypothetical protein
MCDGIHNGMGNVDGPCDGTASVASKQISAHGGGCGDGTGKG